VFASRYLILIALEIATLTSTMSAKPAAARTTIEDSQCFIRIYAHGWARSSRTRFHAEFFL